MPRLLLHQINKNTSTQEMKKRVENVTNQQRTEEEKREKTVLFRGKHQRQQKQSATETKSKPRRHDQYNLSEKVESTQEKMIVKQK